MFWSAFLFELKFRLKSPATWISLVGLVLMAYREMLGGDWDDLIQSGRVLRNSPYAVYYLFMYYTFWTATVGSALVIPTLLRDLRSGASETLYSYPLNSKSYFLGKYLAMMLVLILVMSSVAIGFVTMPFVATVTGAVEASEFGPTPWAHLGHAFLIWVIPSCLVYGSIIYALTALTGRASPAYAIMMMAVGLFVTITAVYGDGAPNYPIVQIFDPLGKVTVEGQIYYWTAEERATRFLAMEGTLLWNRVFYLGTAGALFLLAFWRFDIRKFWALAKMREARSVQRDAPADMGVARSSADRKIINLKRDADNILYWLRHAVRIGLRDGWTVLRDKAFILAMGTLLVMIVNAGWTYIPKDFDEAGALLPKAFVILPKVMYPTLLFGLIGAAFFSVEVCARERSSRMGELVEASPIPTWSLLITKLIGVLLVCLSIALIPLLAVLIIQVGKGYLQPDWADLAHATFLVIAPMMVFYGLISFVVYGMLHNKALAQGVAIVLCITPGIFNELQTIENFMYLWAWPFPIQFSDFRASGQFLERDLSFASYWLSFYACLCVLAFWLWPRGLNGPIAPRLKEAGKRFGAVSVIALAAFAGVFFWNATKIHSIMVVQNEFQPSHKEKAEKADYEKLYASDRNAPQPKIVAAELFVNLTPSRRSADYGGELIIENQSEEPITQLILLYEPFTEILEVNFAETKLQLGEHDDTHKRVVYPLPQTMSPGERATLTLKLRAAYHGFFNGDDEGEGYHGTLLADGTLFADTMWPRFGYDRSKELELAGDRKAFGLGSRLELAEGDAAGHVKELRVSDDAGMLPTTVTVRTEAGHVPVAPGAVAIVGDGEGEQTYQFNMSAAAPWNPLIASAVFEVTEDRWTPEKGGRPVTIQLYHSPRHTSNLDRMMQAAKAALAQASQYWGEYPYQTLKIVETPRGIGAAKASGDMIILPEDKGWIHDTRGDVEYDWITFIISKSIAEIWWYQSLPVADAKGGVIFEDALPTVFAIHMLNAAAGSEMAASFLDITSDAYLRLRAKEDQAEPLAADLDDEEYAAAKSSLVMHSVYERMGGENFMTALGRFHRRLKSDGAQRMANAPALLAELSDFARQLNPSTLLSEILQSTRHYDLRAVTAEANKKDGFELHASIAGLEYKYSDGKDMVGPMDGLVRIVVLGDGRDPLVLHEENVVLKNGQADIELSLAHKPGKIVVDPTRAYPDRSPKNNSIPVRIKS